MLKARILIFGTSITALKTFIAQSNSKDGMCQWMHYKGRCARRQELPFKCETHSPCICLQVLWGYVTGAQGQWVN